MSINPIQLSDRQRRSVLLLLFLIPFLMGCGVDLYVPSLPAIRTAFHTQAYNTQLTISFYMLGYALGQLVFGVLSDALGRRKMIVIPGAFFALSSLLAINASSIDMLIFSRGLQGFFIAGPAVVSRALATDCFKDLELSHAMTYIAMGWSLGPIIGPFLGGYLQDYFSWKANFYFFVLYSVVIFSYAYFVLIETHPIRTPFHPVNFLKNLKTIVSSFSFFIYLLIAACIYSSMILFNLIGPFLIQTHLHFSAVAYGYMALTLGSANFLGNLTNRCLVSRLGQNKMVLIGLLGTLIMAVVLLFLGISYPLQVLMLILPSFLFLFFCGLVFPNAMTKATASFSHMGGTASAIYGTLMISLVFIFTSMGALLPTDSQTPLGAAYSILIGIALFFFGISRLMAFFLFPNAKTRKNSSQ